jgi:hypothetical protein
MPEAMPTLCLTHTSLLKEAGEPAAGLLMAMRTDEGRCTCAAYSHTTACPAVPAHLGSSSCSCMSSSQHRRYVALHVRGAGGLWRVLQMVVRVLGCPRRRRHPPGQACDASKDCGTPSVFNEDMTAHAGQAKGLHFGLFFRSVRRSPCLIVAPAASE